MYDVLSERIMHEITKNLLVLPKIPSSCDVELFCVLWKIIGRKADHIKSKKYVNFYFRKIELLSCSTLDFSEKHKTMMKDVICLRNMNWGLDNNPPTFDVELNVGNKTIKCHKSILSSKSVYFKALFDSGNFNPENDVYGEEMEYLIRYCYNSREVIPSFIQKPLIQLAIVHEMNDLILDIADQIDVTMESVLDWNDFVQELENSMLDPIRDKLVDFLVKNKQFLGEFVDCISLASIWHIISYSIDSGRLI